MKPPVWVWVWITAMAIALAAFGCGGTPEPNFAKVTPTPMAQGQSWSGVYYNPIYGYLHMVEKDGTISGRWKRTDSSRWGELSGTTNGNVFNFAWKEHQYGAIGPSADVKGTGVFVYKGGSEGIPELAGQYAIEGSDSIGDWHCVKQLNMKPDPTSINGDNPAEVPPTQDKWK